MEGRAQERREMVDRQLTRRGIADPKVLRAMAQVPRELFVPPNLAGSAYADGPLPIGAGQTISQPYVVALMVEMLQLQGSERVLEVGAGSGYAAAILGAIAAQVVALERIPELAERARQNIARAGCANVEVVCSDGTLGYPAAAPYDAIVVSAGAPDVPEVLARQLRVGGRLVVPVGSSRREQNLMRITRRENDDFETADLGPVHFVPLIGKAGWSESD